MCSHEPRWERKTCAFYIIVHIILAFGVGTLAVTQEEPCLSHPGVCKPTRECSNPMAKIGNRWSCPSSGDDIQCCPTGGGGGGGGGGGSVKQEEPCTSHPGVCKPSSQCSNPMEKVGGRWGCPSSGNDIQCCPTGGPPPSQTGTGVLSHAQAEGRVRNAGISIWSTGGCSNRNSASCTSLDQIRENTINQIVNLKQNSGCPITITGGTEEGHGRGPGQSHWNGYKLDISKGSCIDNYITSNFKPAGIRSDNAQMYRSSGGNTYANEGNHWDIVYV